MVTILGMLLCAVPGAEPAPAPKASDVEQIARWVGGKDPGGMFTHPFGDRKLLADSKVPLLYTDVSGVSAPAGMKAANYEQIQARMRRIRNGHRAAPAVLIVRSSLEEPAEDEPVREIRAKKDRPAGRVYYVEVAIGNLAWHRLKVVVHEEGDRPKAQILWTKVS
jgi:hypothetical protein